MDSKPVGLSVTHLGGERFRVTLSNGLSISMYMDVNAGELQMSLARAYAEFAKWNVVPVSPAYSKSEPDNRPTP